MVGSKPGLRVLSPASAGWPPRGCGGAARWCAATTRGTEMAKSKVRASTARPGTESRSKVKRAKPVVHQTTLRSKQAAVLALLSRPSGTTGRPPLTALTLCLPKMSSGKLSNLPRRTIIPGSPDEAHWRSRNSRFLAAVRIRPAPLIGFELRCVGACPPCAVAGQRQFGQRPIQPARADHSPVTTGRSASVLINPNIAARSKR